MNFIIIVFGLNTYIYMLILIIITVPTHLKKILITFGAYILIYLTIPFILFYETLTT